MRDLRLLPWRDETCALVDCYAVSSGNFLPTFRENLPVPTSRSLRNNREQRGSQEIRFFNYDVIQLTIKINTYKTCTILILLIKDHVCFIDKIFFQFNILCVTQFSMIDVFTSSVPAHMRTAWREHWWEVKRVNKMRFKKAYYTDSYSLYIIDY
jgi:hypothetical protein